LGLYSPRRVWAPICRPANRVVWNFFGLGNDECRHSLLAHLVSGWK
jgi:hypothetical protein